ncbi:transmembrane protein 272-like isoform X1 [Tubulanus polymorphus]|uniref:transmembrane protein 272-like isoform X1 n=1 Tax=Tubulanus polymorphus TaxID=672921 RepID=UPI003DA32F68
MADAAATDTVEVETSSTTVIDRDEEDPLLAYQRRLYRSRQRRPPNSLIGQVKAAKRQSLNICQFILKSGEIISRSMVILCVCILICLFPATLIVIGFIYRNDCPIQYLLPLYVMFYGFTGTFLVFPIIIRGLTECDEDIRRRGCCSYIWYTLALFFLVWLVFGTVLIFQTWSFVSYDIDSKGLYCQKALYVAAVWTTGSTYVFLVLLFTFFAAICIKITVEPHDY